MIWQALLIVCTLCILSLINGGHSLPREKYIQWNLYFPPSLAARFDHVAKPANETSTEVCWHILKKFLFLERLPHTFVYIPSVPFSSSLPRTQICCWSNRNHHATKNLKGVPETVLSCDSTESDAHHKRLLFCMRINSCFFLFFSFLSF